MVRVRLGAYILLAIAGAGTGVSPLVAQNETPLPPSTLPDVISPASQSTSPANGPEQPQDQPAIGKLPPSPVELRDQEVKQVDPLDREQEKKDREKAERQARKRAQQDVPVPGSIAESQRNAAGRTGPEVEDDDKDTPVQEYTGPAVLSRSYSIGQSLVPEQIKWHDSFGANSIYDTGISRSINADGSLGPKESLHGASAAWSLGGRQYFHRDSLSVDYSGNYSQYSGSGQGFTGANQSISVAYLHRLSRRFAVNLGGNGSLQSQNSVLENQPVGAQTIANVNLQSSPNIQIFDSGAKQMNLSGDLTWQQSARLSFSMGGSYFGIARDTPLLLGVTGDEARADVTYRFTRQSTIGTYFQYSRYIYPHAVGNSDAMTFGAIYSYAFTRTMQLRFRGGLSVVQSLGLVTVPIPPPIAALLGVSVGIADSYATYRTTDISAQFIKDFRHGRTASLAYAHGISPGNGVFQTSQQESISGSLNATVFRSYSLNLAVGRDTLGTVTQSVVANLGKYQSDYARLSLGKSYRRGVGASLSLEYRHFTLETPGYARNQLRVTSGVTWGSGNGKLWPF